MTDYSPPERRFTGRAMLLAMLAFFGVIIAVNGTMLTLAVNSFGGLVVGNSYVASQNFDRDVAAARAQPIHGWDIAVVAGPASVAVEMRDGAGAALTGLSPTLSIRRTTHERGAMEGALVEGSAGRYTAPLALGPGLWRATIRTADGQTRSLTFTRGDR